MATFKKNSIVVLGLGSNMGDRSENIKKAIKLLSLSCLEIISLSDIYINEALLLNDSPESWNKDFLNISILGKTNLEPEELLSKIKDIEKRTGRELNERWAPRVIDIDILIYEDKIINKDNLTIPHKELLNRDFIILSLVDIIPNWYLPGTKKTIDEIYKSSKIIRKSTKKFIES